MQYRRVYYRQPGLGTLPPWSPIAVIGTAFILVLGIGWLASRS